MTPKLKYKMFALAVMAGARAFIQGDLAKAIFDMIEEDIILNWDEIWDKSQKKKILIGMVKKIGKAGMKDEPYAALLQCLEECEVESDTKEESEE